ncbi:MAG: Uncharacterized protein XD63_0727 [Thermoanaerobacterales bacterium 50_218]|nr:MAG: Uncharacterized protein XD63_0727 [Thermoanaerobacterales bacterium 50_218]HAA90222.1 hypothetical protein [Peptococcaceae bacterium]
MEQYAETYQVARVEFARSDPQRMAELSGCLYRPEEGAIIVPYLSRDYKVYHPSGEIVPCEGAPELYHEEKILILQYLAQASGVPLAGRWIAYSELPGGMCHDLPCKIETVKPLAETFGRQPQKLLEAARRYGGSDLDLGDVGVAISVFPRLRVAVFLWVGDEELPPSASFVFDAAASQYLSTAALYIVGSFVTRRLCEAVSV